jgi:predicted ferric reductase
MKASTDSVLIPRQRARHRSEGPSSTPSHLPMRPVAPAFAGPTVIAGLVAVQALLWCVLRPGDQPVGGYVGQAVGAMAILLMSLALVLVSTLPWVEPWFGGVDRAAIWHRRVAIVGTALLPVHAASASNEAPSRLGPALGVVGMAGLLALVLWSVLPRWRSVLPRGLHAPIGALTRQRPAHLVASWLGGYGRWRNVHRLIGLFVAAGAVHGLVDGTVFSSPVLRGTYLAEAGVGLAFYLYREVIASWVVAQHDYQVDAVTDLGHGLTELSLRPRGRPRRFVPGQFALVYVEGKDGWHRHPFSISSAPSEPRVRFTVKALGDYTSRLRELVEPGMPAVIGTPHGHFDHRRGTQRQVWIAGGVGVAPFLSWLRSADECALPDRVDFFCSTDGPSPFAEEITAVAAAHPRLRVHLVNTRTDGRLTGKRILETVCDRAHRAQRLSVFMCGPEPMLQALRAAFRSAGMPGRHIHREYFDWR